MRRRLMMLGMLGMIVALMTVACSGDRVWFAGGLDEARAVAAERDTLVLVDFYTDWCSWCRRLEADTFSDPEVRDALAGMVAIKVNAEKGGEELAEQLGVGSYPTIVFLDAAGEEVDRILGYLPPDSFLERLRRVRSGDTFASCLGRLTADPTDLDALRRSVAGLLTRSDPGSALEWIRHYHEAGGTDGCQVLLFEAASAMHTRLYERAARLYRKDALAALEVDDPGLAPALAALAAAADPPLWELSDEQQARELRQARTADATKLLALVDATAQAPDTLLEACRFAFANGAFDQAGDLAVQWLDQGGETLPVDELNEIAWSLYLARVEPETAIAMARTAIQRKPSAGVADTLGRLLYAAGETAEAAAVEARAVRLAEEAEASGSEISGYRAALEQIQAGEPLADAPAFERYPGSRSSVL